jgi:tetratricopeptide (TPR) repeat protein
LDWQRWGWWAAIFLILMLVVGIWLRPYVLTIYHLERGGRAVDVALEPVFTDRLAPERVVDEEALAEAKAHLEIALRWNPDNVEVRRQLARVYLSIGEPRTALDVLQQALDLRERHLLLHLEVGDLYDALGYTDRAIEAYETGRVGSRALPLTANYLKDADAWVERGSEDVAIQLWQDVLDLDPDNLYALYRLWGAYRRLGADAEVARYAERLHELDAKTLAVPLDFRLAEYQARAMLGLVEDGLWEREKLLNIVSYQVEDVEDILTGLMTERVLTTLLEARPGDVELLAYLDALYQRLEALGQFEMAREHVLDIQFSIFYEALSLDDRRVLYG